MSKKFSQNIGGMSLNALFALVCLVCLSPLFVFNDLLFPFVTSKAFFFRIFVELALPFYLYLIWLRKDLRISWKNPIFVAVVSFLSFGFVSAFVGVNTFNSIWGNFERMGGVYYLAHLGALFLYVILLAKAGGTYLKNLLYFLLGVAVLVSLNGLLSKIGMPIFRVDSSISDRVSSTLGNPIFLASYLIIPLAFTAFFARQAFTVWQKVLYGGLFFVQLTVLFLSGTRGALVGLVLGIIFSAGVYVLLNKSKKARFYTFAGLLVLLSVIAGALIFKNSFSSYGMGRLLSFQDNNSKARLIQWNSAWQGFLERPMFGAGPENFYFVSNKFYKPEMVQYDPSWFDKPHNYMLEVLATHGIFGFISYLGIIVLALSALYKAYRDQIIDLVEMCVLVAGFTAYFVQNLFVFDTVSAAIMFFVFIGFCSFLWDEATGKNLEENNKSNSSYQEIFYGRIILGVSTLVVLYAVSITNIIPMSAAKKVNAGVATITSDPEAGNKYFQEAINSTFNFSIQDTTIRYSDAARGVAQNSRLSSESKTKILNEIVVAQRKSAEKVKNDPLSWIKLSYGLFILDVTANREVGEDVEKYAKSALSFAPNRYDPHFQLYQVYSSRHKVKEEGGILEEINNKFPLTAFTAESRWALAYWDFKNEKEQDAIKLAEVLIERDYPPQSLLDILWLLDYYDKQKDYPALLKATKLGVKGLPNNKDLPLVLAQAYASNGLIQEAIDTANALAKSDPASQSRVQEFIKSLK